MAELADGELCSYREDQSYSDRDPLTVAGPGGQSEIQRISITVGMGSAGKGI
jgi:hypothetical protein